jgi:dCTP deaminase
VILCDREIRAAIARGALGITPVPAPAAWSSTAVDLTLDKDLTYWEPPGGSGPEAVFCPHSPDYDFSTLAGRYARQVDITSSGHIIGPGQFVLGWTVEKVRLPHPFRVAARVEGKSSLARLGLGVHVTAPTIHSGFGTTAESDFPGSPIRLEIWNVGPLRIKLEVGMPVCQLIFELVDGTPEKGYAGQFNIQGPRG